MLVYQGSISEFKELVLDNKIADVMLEGFKNLGQYIAPNEIRSWDNSLTKLKDAIDMAGLTDNMIALEYEVPYNQKRIDALLFGNDSNRSSNVVLIELKQWDNVLALDDEGNFVETYTGKPKNIVPHPSQQIKGYHNYLLGFIEEFEKQPPIILFSCAYCHNYKKKEGQGLFAPVYDKIIEDFPIYTKEDVRLFADKLKSLLASGEGIEVFNRFMRSPLKPSKKLLENVSKVIQNEAVFSLLNEQLVAKNLIWSKVRKAKRDNKKSVIIVHGGPGTGKSLIALNVLADAAQRGNKVFYGCKSKPFIEGLKHLVGDAGEPLFSNLYRFIPNKVKENELDLLLIDEAHRIGKTSNHQYTKTHEKSDMPQIDQLITCAKTSVFFIDDRQNVRSQEIGHSDLIRATAAKLGCDLSEVILETQYRCMGSNDYLLWLESVLGYDNTNRILKKNEIFDFRIFSSPQEMYDVIKEKEQEKINSARLVAGFCWPWAKSLDANGEFVKDVKIGSFEMPWETHDKITRIPKGYVKWYEWGYKTNGIKQIGCIYTAQGFEYDYIGVIIGDDLIYNPAIGKLDTNISATCDPTLKKGKDSFDTHVKNIYRTLMTRGMKGCYVYFTNKDTEKYFKSKIE